MDTSALRALALLPLIAQAGCSNPQDGGNFHLATVAVCPQRALMFLSRPSSGAVDVLRLPREGQDSSLRHVTRLREPGRTRVLRLAVDLHRGRLWVADFMSVYAYELDALALAGRYDLPAMLYYERVSDLTVDRQGNVFVLARGGARIYRIDARTLHMDLWLDVSNNAKDAALWLANRLLKSADERYLLLVSSVSGALLRIEVSTRSITPVELGAAADFTCGLLFWNEEPASLQVFDCADQWAARVDLDAHHSAGSLQLSGQMNPRVHAAVTRFGPY